MAATSFTFFERPHRLLDGTRCLVAPSPEYRAKLNEELKQFRGSASGFVARNLRVRGRNRVGMNDGLIYPGDYFGLGTSADAARRAAIDRAPLRGRARVVVVLVDFSDRPFQQTKEHFDELFFSTGALPNGSVREYYREVTCNLVDIVGEVKGPYRMPRTLSDYAHDASGIGDDLPNARTMALDAAIAADTDIDFAPYDNDEDGFVDAFIVVHAGAGAETNGDAGDIWSHKWVLPSGAYAADDTRIFAYLTVPEDAKIGVCCHELGHLLFGFPDLYDTDYTSAGIGDWCLMGGGSWNGGGEIPAHPSAWCKANQGWVSVVNQTGNAHLSIEDVQSGRKVYRLWKDGVPGNEYFLLENRQRSNYDRRLPGDGLLIWHVDEAISTNSDEAHPKVALVQADDQRDLERGVNGGDGGDAYPGSTNNTAFNASSRPSSRSYGGRTSCVAVSGIGPSAPIMTASVGVQCTVRPRRRPTVKAILDKEALAEALLQARELLEARERKGIKELEQFAKGREKQKEAARAPEAVAMRGMAGYGAPAMSAAVSEIEARLRSAEERLKTVETLIEAAVRPEFIQGALPEEEEEIEAGDGRLGRAGGPPDTRPQTS